MSGVVEGHDGGGRMRRIVVNAATVALWLSCAALLGYAGRRALGGPASAMAPRELADWERVAAVGHQLGAEDAPIRLVEFTVFQCAFCARGATRLHDLQERYPGRLALFVRHFPLISIHPHAFAAAIAAECAAAQGRFAAYRDALFRNQEALGVVSWTRLAVMSGVPDSLAFDRCVREESFRSVIVRDFEEGRRLGVLGTPTFILEGTMLAGSDALDRIEEAVAGLDARN